MSYSNDQYVSQRIPSYSLNEVDAQKQQETEKLSSLVNQLAVQKDELNRKLLIKAKLNHERKILVEQLAKQNRSQDLCKNDQNKNNNAEDQQKLLKLQLKKQTLLREISAEKDNAKILSAQDKVLAKQIENLQAKHYAQQNQISKSKQNQLIQEEVVYNLRLKKQRLTEDTQQLNKIRYHAENRQKNSDQRIMNELLRLENGRVAKNINEYSQFYQEMRQVQFENEKKKKLVELELLTERWRTLDNENSKRLYKEAHLAKQVEFLQRKQEKLQKVEKQLLENRKNEMIHFSKNSEEYSEMIDRMQVKNNHLQGEKSMVAMDVRNADWTNRRLQQEIDYYRMILDRRDDGITDEVIPFHRRKDPRDISILPDPYHTQEKPERQETINTSIISGSRALDEEDTDSDVIEEPVHTSDSGNESQDPLAVNPVVPIVSQETEDSQFDNIVAENLATRVPDEILDEIDRISVELSLISRASKQALDTTPQIEESEKTEIDQGSQEIFVSTRKDFEEVSDELESVSMELSIISSISSQKSFKRPSQSPTNPQSFSQKEQEILDKIENAIRQNSQATSDVQHIIASLSTTTAEINENQNENSEDTIKQPASQIEVFFTTETTEDPAEIVSQHVNNESDMVDSETIDNQIIIQKPANEQQQNLIDLSRSVSTWSIISEELELIDIMDLDEIPDRPFDSSNKSNNKTNNTNQSPEPWPVHEGQIEWIRNNLKKVDGNDNSTVPGKIKIPDQFSGTGQSESNIIDSEIDLNQTTDTKISVEPSVQSQLNDEESSTVHSSEFKTPGDIENSTSSSTQVPPSSAPVPFPKPPAPPTSEPGTESDNNSQNQTLKEKIKNNNKKQRPHSKEWRDPRYREFLKMAYPDFDTQSVASDATDTYSLISMNSFRGRHYQAPNLDNAPLGKNVYGSFRYKGNGTYKYVANDSTGRFVYSNPLAPSPEINDDMDDEETFTNDDNSHSVSFGGNRASIRYGRHYRRPDISNMSTDFGSVSTEMILDTDTYDV